jgi:hypothetical protein
MQRRRLIKWLWASSLAFASGPSFSLAEHPSTDKIALLKSAYKPSAATINTGKKCFAAKPTQYSLNQLFEIAGINNVETSTQLVNAFEAKRKTDLLSANTETVNGWVLARSEASMIAILSQI